MLGCAAAQQPASTSATPAGILAPFHHLSFLKLYWFDSGDLAGAPSSLRQVHMVLPGSSFIHAQVTLAMLRFERLLVDAAAQGGAPPQQLELPAAAEAEPEPEPAAVLPEAEAAPEPAAVLPEAGEGAQQPAAAEEEEAPPQPAAAAEEAGEAAHVPGAAALQAEQAPGGAGAVAAAAAAQPVDWAAMGAATAAAAAALPDVGQAVQQFELLTQQMEAAVTAQGMLTPIIRVSEPGLDVAGIHIACVLLSARFGAACIWWEPQARMLCAGGWVRQHAAT